MKVYLGSQPINLDPTNAIGQGGEANVYRHASGLALKVFKGPNDPEFAGNPEQQEAAREKLAEHQRKLLSFPKGLPANVILPQAMVRSSPNGSIVGYEMRLIEGSQPLLKYAQRSFREQGIDSNAVVRIFENLHGTVGGVHNAGVVLGDFNNLNVLVTGTVDSWIIDADSLQFGPYLCRMFTDRFVDPTLCDPKAKSPKLIKPHNANSDWYAFAVMLFESMLFVDPYGGIFKPTNPREMVPHGTRPLRRITVFDKRVRYPKPATPITVLPDDLLEQFHLIFEKDRRETFPIGILKNLRWTRCSTCHIEHARGTCPNCHAGVPVPTIVAARVNGKVTVTVIFKTSGVILCSSYQDKLRFLCHEDGAYKRDTERTKIQSGRLDTKTRYRVQRELTHMAKGNQLVTINPSGSPSETTRTIDTFGILPMFDANGEKAVWMQGGVIMRDGELGPEYPETIGEALPGQTLLWTGSKFGFGFYRAGNLSVAFTFGLNSTGINDSITLPKISGKLTDSTCVFSEKQCWFFITTQENGKTKNHCFLISRGGEVLASASADAGTEPWLDSIRGKAAMSNFLFSATDDCIVRVEAVNGNIIKTRDYPDTEPFVDDSSQLHVSAKGIYVVDLHEIRLLQIS